MENLNFQQIALIYLAVYNVATFFMFCIDKWKYNKYTWRTNDTALLMLAVLGGSIGAWIGIIVCYHKTQKKKFRYGVPAIIIIQLALIGYLLYR